MIARQFGHPSGFAGRAATLAMNIMNRRQYRAVVDNLDLRATDTVLDVGFGNGRLLRCLSRYNPRKLYGIDPSADMVGSVSIPGAELLLADVGAIPLPDASVDKAYTVNTVYFWGDLREGFGEIARVLRPGGLLLDVFYGREWLDKLSVTQYGFHKYTPSQIAEATAAAGLTVERTVEIQRNKSYCVVARKK